MKCPQCQATSGDDWSQCMGICPMPMSPYYSPIVAVQQAGDNAPEGMARVATYDDWFVEYDCDR